MTRSSPESKVAVIVMGWQPCDLSGDVCLQDRLDEDTGHSAPCHYCVYSHFEEVEGLMQSVSCKC